MADSPCTMGLARLIEARRASHDIFATAPGFGRLDLLPGHLTRRTTAATLPRLAHRRPLRSRTTHRHLLAARRRHYPRLPALLLPALLPGPAGRRDGPTTAVTHRPATRRRAPGPL